MDDPAVEALRRLVAATTGGRKAVANAIRAHDQTLYQILEGVPLDSGKPRTVGRSLRERLTKRFPRWLDPAPAGGELSMAHVMTLTPVTLSENRLTWEQIVAGADLGDQFSTQMTDDSCGDRAPRGHWVVWRPDKRPEFGKLVLARDAHNQLHARVYSQGRLPGQWRAAAVNPAFASFDGDELTIIAVARGVLEPD